MPAIQRKMTMRTYLISNFGHLRTLRVGLVAVAMITLAVSPAFVAGCGTGINLVSMDEEWEMGRQLEQDINRQLRLTNDATVNNYMAGIARSIVSQTPMANRSWRFYVVQDAEINAFNAPGGLVYVNTGLIAATQNTSELAGVIAHEIAHGVQRHGTQRLSTAYGLNFAAAILLGGNPGMLSQIAAQLAAGGALAQNSRAAEREADQLGVRYMAAAGYHPDGMASMFETLLQQSQSQPGAVARFFSTHPLTQDRIQAVRQQTSSMNTSGLARNTGQHSAARSRAQQLR